MHSRSMYYCEEVLEIAMSSKERGKEHLFAHERECECTGRIAYTASSLEPARNMAWRMASSVGRYLYGEQNGTRQKYTGLLPKF